MRTRALALPLLLLGLACSNKQSGDDDSSGGASGETGSGGKSGSGGKGSGGTQGGSDATGGTSAASGTGGDGVGGSSGGDTSIGGSSATSGTGQGASGGDMSQGGDGQAGDMTTGTGGTDGGAGATGGAGGTGGDGATGGSGGTPSGEPALVELLVDGSSSMFENGMWDQVYASLVTDGVLEAFQGKLDLGLSVFQGSPVSSTEMSASCATMTNVDFATDSGADIASTLSNLGTGFVVGTKYETPTGFAVRYVTMVLGSVTVPADVKKYIVLVTDGAPNTCVVLDPQCGEDVSIQAVQEARAAGIRTLPVGLDPILDVGSGCPASARCGLDHLQDLANAGVAEPVEPPNTVNFIHEPCNNGVSLLASYAAVGGGGDATYYVSTNDGGLSAELTKAFQAIVDDAVK